MQRLSTLHQQNIGNVIAPAYNSNQATSDSDLTKSLELIIKIKENL